MEHFVYGFCWDLLAECLPHDNSQRGNRDFNPVSVFNALNNIYGSQLTVLFKLLHFIYIVFLR